MSDDLNKANRAKFEKRMQIAIFALILLVFVLAYVPW
jgi:hypothetical protein